MDHKAKQMTRINITMEEIQRIRASVGQLSQKLEQSSHNNQKQYESHSSIPTFNKIQDKEFVYSQPMQERMQLLISSKFEELSKHIKTLTETFDKKIALIVRSISHIQGKQGNQRKIQDWKSKATVQSTALKRNQIPLSEKELEKVSQNRNRNRVAQTNLLYQNFGREQSNPQNHENQQKIQDPSPSSNPKKADQYDQFLEQLDKKLGNQEDRDFVRANQMFNFDDQEENIEYINAFPEEPFQPQRQRPLIFGWKNKSAYGNQQTGRKELHSHEERQQYSEIYPSQGRENRSGQSYDQELSDYDKIGKNHRYEFLLSSLINP